MGNRRLDTSQLNLGILLVRAFPFKFKFALARAIMMPVTARRAFEFTQAHWHSKFEFRIV